MEAKALIKTMEALTIEIENTRLVAVSRGAKLEEFNHKTRHLKLDKRDAMVEMDAQVVRKDMREFLKEMEELAGKFEGLHASGSSNESLREHASRLLTNARSLGATVGGIVGSAHQTHNALRSSHFGVLGWNIHHDAQGVEEIVARIVKICQRVFSGTEIE